MADYWTAVWSVLGIAIALGMLFFSVKLSMLFQGGKIARGWQAFAFSAGILTIISVLSLANALNVMELPSWWREGSAFVFRLALIYALFQVYQAWTRLVPKK